MDNGLSYIYDAEGRRVGKSDGTVYVVGLSGDVLDELNNNQWRRSEIELSGRHLATVTPLGVVFTHADWLGTERARTGVTGAPCESITSQPFGDSLAKVTPPGEPGCDPTPDFFTGKQRDGESNLDDFGARYFSSQWGRWMSPDWAAQAQAVPYATLGNPQSLNLYAYVGNDPVAGEDPDGHATYQFGDGLRDNGDGMAVEEILRERHDQQTPASKPPAFDPSCNCFRVQAARPSTPHLSPLDFPGWAFVGLYDLMTNGHFLHGAKEMGYAYTGQAVLGWFGEAADGAEFAEGMVEGAADEAATSESVDNIVKTIDEEGFEVTANPKSSSQESNVTITHPNEPGAKLNLRTESHPLEPGGKPVRHTNVERVEPGAKNRPVVKSNTHID